MEVDVMRSQAREISCEGNGKTLMNKKYGDEYRCTLETKLWGSEEKREVMWREQYGVCDHDEYSGYIQPVFNPVQNT